MGSGAPRVAAPIFRTWTSLKIQFPRTQLTLEIFDRQKMSAPAKSDKKDDGKKDAGAIKG